MESVRYEAAQAGWETHQRMEAAQQHMGLTTERRKLQDAARADREVMRQYEAAERDQRKAAAAAEAAQIEEEGARAVLPILQYPNWLYVGPKRLYEYPWWSASTLLNIERNVPSI